MTVNAADLTTLANVKAYLRIPSGTTTNDGLLQTLITGVSKRIHTICGRYFPAANYIERINTFTKQTRTQVKNKPIIAVNNVRWGYANCMYFNFVWPGALVFASFQTTPTSLIFTIQQSGQAATSTTFLYTNYQTTAALGTALNSAYAGLSVTVQNDVPTQYLYPTSGLNLLSGGNKYSQALAYPNVDNFTYTVDYDQGTLAFQPLSSMDYFFTPDGRSATTISFPQGYQSLVIDYRGGYETIPEDIDLLAQELVAAAYQMGIRDPNLVSETLGDYTYTLVDPVVRAQYVQSRLQHYMRIGIAGGMA